MLWNIRHTLCHDRCKRGLLFLSTIVLIVCTVLIGYEKVRSTGSGLHLWMKHTLGYHGTLQQLNSPWRCFTTVLDVSNEKPMKYMTKPIRLDVNRQQLIYHDECEGLGITSFIISLYGSDYKLLYHTINIRPDHRMSDSIAIGYRLFYYPHGFSGPLLIILLVTYIFRL